MVKYFNCSEHGEQTSWHIVGDKNYCQNCIQSIFDIRIKNYEISERDE